jgi:hypothetical protein
MTTPAKTPPKEWKDMSLAQKASGIGCLGVLGLLFIAITTASGCWVTPMSKEESKTEALRLFREADTVTRFCDANYVKTTKAIQARDDVETYRSAKEAVRYCENEMVEWSTFAGKKGHAPDVQKEIDEAIGKCQIHSHAKVNAMKAIMAALDNGSQTKALADLKDAQESGERNGFFCISGLRQAAVLAGASDQELK